MPTVKAKNPPARPVSSTARTRSQKKAPVKNDFVFSKPFQRGEDSTSYRLVTKSYVKKARFGGKPVLVVDPRALSLLAHEAMRDVSFLLRPKHQQQVAAILQDPEASPNDRFMATTLLRNAVGLGEVRAAVLPGHRHRDGRRLEGPAGLDRSRRRGAPLEGDLEDLHRGEPPLLADGRAHDVRRGQHRQQPAGADRHLRDAGHGVQVPLRGQGRRLGEQERISSRRRRRS